MPKLNGITRESVTSRGDPAIPPETRDSPRRIAPVQGPERIVGRIQQWQTNVRNKKGSPPASTDLAKQERQQIRQQGRCERRPGKVTELAGNPRLRPQGLEQHVVQQENGETNNGERMSQSGSAMLLKTQLAHTQRCPSIGQIFISSINHPPGLDLRLVNQTGYSPDFNADESIWGWTREEATGNLCLGSRAADQEMVGNFLAGLSRRKDEVRRLCWTVLQSRA